jgi:arsenite methyltransferase
MSDSFLTEPSFDLERLRQAIRKEYAAVAHDPGRGYHFHTGRPLASMLGYHDDWLEGLPEGSIASFAGTGNPFRICQLQPGECVVDIGSGAGIDSLIAAKMVGPEGQVIGVDMTPTMLEVARKSAREAGTDNVEFREGLAESLPVPDSWADVVISNGVLNPAFRQTRGLSGDGPRTQTHGSPPDRGYPGAAGGASGRETADRSVDGLNCRCSAGSRTEGHGRGCGLR